MHRAPDGLLLQNGAGEPRRERVDGDEPPGDAAGALHRLKNRIEHLAVRFERERSEETVGLAVVKRGGKIRLVKKGEGELSGAVGDGQARDVKALADVRGFGACDDHCLKACGNARLERADLGGMRAVFVGAREIGNEVVERPDGQLFKLRRAGGLDAAQSGHGRCKRQRLHPKHHLSGRIQGYFNVKCGQIQYYINEKPSGSSSRGISMNEELSHLVQFQGNAALFAGSVILVNNSLADGLIDGLNGCFVSAIGLLTIAFGNCSVELLQSGSQDGLVHLVALVVDLGNQNSFLGRLNVGHDYTSSNSVSDETSI